MAVLTTIPTPITTLDRIDFVGSPRHITVSDNNLKSVEIFLWIWDGDVTKPYDTSASETIPIKKNIVSSTDKFITVEVSKYIKTFINAKASFSNAVIASNEGVYWQYQAILYSTPGGSGNPSASVIRVDNPVNRFATLGYNWGYEGEHPLLNLGSASVDNGGNFSYSRGSFGFYDDNIGKKYYNGVVYSTPSIDLTGVTSSVYMVKRTNYTPTCSEILDVNEPIIIIYLNRQGFFDTFNISGRVQYNSKISNSQYNVSTRTGSEDRTTFHGTKTYNRNVRQSITINTGLLTEEMGQLVEEIKYSEKIYLIIFAGPIYGSSFGLTADSTVVTADSILYTADNEGSGVISGTSYTQIPVTIDITDFDRMGQINEKANIHYNLRFIEANDKINNLI